MYLEMYFFMKCGVVMNVFFKGAVLVTVGIRMLHASFQNLLCNFPMCTTSYQKMKRSQDK